MNETRFIKSAVFGGYDKADTDEHIKALHARIAALETELKTALFSLEKFTADTPNDIIKNTVINEIREELAASGAENKNLARQVQCLSAEKQELEKQIVDLKYSVAELEHNLSEADMKLLSMSQKDDAAVFGAVFASAKKSASEIIETAQKKAENLKADSEKLAENIVAEANNQAADIVYEAEVYAAEMTAEVSEENLQAIPENVKALVLSNVEALSGCMNNFRKSFTELLSAGNKILEKSGNILNETRNTIIQGGVPVFRNIEIDIDLPEKPAYEPTDYSYTATENIPEKVQEIQKTEIPAKPDPVAEYYNNQDYTVQNSNNFDSYDYDYDYDENSPDFEDIDRPDVTDDDDLSGLVRNIPRGSGGVNFRALDRQAEEFMGIKKAENNSSEKPEKSGGVNLTDLAAQAQALENDDAPSPPKKKSSGGIDLATLAAQAAALDD
ncbi:MAG: hypothetical protein NC244_06670 [Alistipes senegalensis]|nr:hypothetical protein [Alistipes senegalensis]